jgi:non-ribosomal peptide synthetase component F
MEWSLGLVVTLLGCLKAGAAFVPIDPSESPEKRQQYIMSDTNAAVCVTSSTGATLLTACPPGVVNIRVGPRGEVVEVKGVKKRETKGSERRRKDGVTPIEASLAYVTYVSGATGRPKGVCVRHESLSHCLQAFVAELGMVPGDVMLGLTSPSSDAFILEALLPLVTGASLALVSSKTRRQGRALAGAVARLGVNFLQATPATLEMLLEAGWTGAHHVNVLCGGEPFRPSLAPLTTACRSFRCLYGVSEACVWSSCVLLRHAPRGAVPLGKPLPGVELYVVDAKGGLADKGELYVGGKGVGRGYWSRVDVTAEHYVKNPFGEGR